MDKLKEQLAVLKQHSFWIMCGGILIVSLVSWYLSTNSVAERHQSQLSAIKQVFDLLDNLRRANEKHPNAATAQGMDQLTQAYSEEVRKGWQMQYEQQAKVLVWPASFDTDFHKAVDKYRPIETLRPGAAITQELPQNLLQIYRNYIEVDLPTLATTIGAQWQASSSGPMNVGGALPMPPVSVAGVPGVPPEDKSIVLWSPENQQQILLTHFGFVTGEVPTTLQVLYAQEDLWVLQNIMNIIKATNGDATARHEAVIKQIEYVRIGRSAIGLVGAVTPLGTPGIPGSQPVGGGEHGAAGGMPAPAAPAFDPTTGLPVIDTTDPAAGRYVDENYQPLDPARLRNALTSREESEALLAVAKRIPVRLRFKLDQRKLNVLLTECGNAKLPVEVRQVRINRDGSGSTASGLGPGMPIPGGAPGKTLVNDSTVDPNLMDVELFGVVYIYNPVNKSQLGLEGAPATAGLPANLPVVGAGG